MSPDRDRRRKWRTNPIPSPTGTPHPIDRVHLRSGDDAERLDRDELDDERITFVDETDFEKAAVVAVYFAFPGAGSVEIDVIRRSDAAVVYTEFTPAGVHIDGDLLVLIRVMPENDDVPDDATIVIENDPANDDERIEFGTIDDRSAPES